MMKKLSIWFILTLTLVLGFTSCEDIEEFEPCPEISINVENETGSAVYRFVAQLDSIEKVKFTWSIDGEAIDTGSINDVAGQIFDYRFEPGTYTVCVKMADNDCPVEVCTDIVVERDENDPCPDLFFESRQYEGPLTYKFIADFEGIENVSYGWFINDEFVEDSAPNEDNYLIWGFAAPGRYEICIKTETPDCPEGTSYCKVIEIEEEDLKCPDVRFKIHSRDTIITGNDTIHKYKFIADFEGVDRVRKFKWFVDDVQIENPEAQQNGGEYFFHEFTTAGVYKVCLKVEAEGCDEEVMFCEEVVIDNSSVVDCPDLFFIAEKDGDNPAYYFQVEFEGANDVEWLGWYINDKLVEDSNNGDNNRFYYQFEPGRYEVCLFTETPECPEGTSYCKVIEIEALNGCPELFFEAEQDGDNPAYYFYPREFEGMADVVLEWSINGELVDSASGSANPFYYQFNSGEYNVCLMIETPDCPEGIKYCKTITVQ